MWPEKWCIYPYMETSLNEYRKINQNSRSALYIENRTTQVFFFFSPYRNCCLYFNYKTKSALTQESVWILLIANQYIFNQYFYISDESKNMIWNQAYSVLFFFFWFLRWIHQKQIEIQSYAKNFRSICSDLKL